MIILTDKKSGVKSLHSPDYNYVFNQKTGEFARWGKTWEDDPKVGMLEIFDLEISTICEGVPRPGENVAIPCGHCYKSLTQKGENMSLDTLKQILGILPKSTTQVAYGIGSIDSHPDLVRILEYTRSQGVVPNLTTNGYRVDEAWANTLSKYLGGVAVSVYENKDVAYNAVEKLVAAGIHQCNLHQVVSVESFDRCKEVIIDAATDPRLKGLKAILFLTLKPKGKRNKSTTLKDVPKYRELIDLAAEKGIMLGMDSCSAPIYLKAIQGHPQFDKLAQMVESCESNRFSGYANVKGEYWHCSFTEDQPGWKGVDLLSVTDFDKEVWNHEEVKKFRSCLTCQDNKHIGPEVYLCPIYDLYNEEIGMSPNVKETLGKQRKIFEIKEMK